jgi:hypothetical protein
MGIKLDISAETPLSDDDRDILAGLSVMMLAIANRQNLADQPHMQEQEAGQDPFDDEPAECGRFDDDGRVCVREAGHSGRHRYRPLALAFSGNGLEN